MKKKNILFSLLASLFMICIFATATHVSAADYYQTNKANVPIWSQASSNSTKRRTVASANTVLSVVGSTTNSSGNLWYKLSDGNWVYSGNVTKHYHSYSGGICTNSTCRYEYPLSVSSYYATVEVKNTSGAKIWSRPYSSNSTHYRTEAYQKLLSIVARTTNQEGHVWYKLSDGSWVYGDNVKTHSHSYSGGICTNGYCRYEYPYSVSSYSATVEVKNTNGAKIWSRPYSSNSTHYRTEAYQKILKIVAKTTNQENHVWYKLSDGSWVYSDNVKTHSHSYKGGICTNGYCKYEYPYSVSSYSATVEVINKSGAKIMSRPYSSNSTLYRTEALGKVFKVTSKTTNQEGNVWYKLSDGSWVFSENVKKHSHTYSGGICTNSTCKYEYAYTVSSYSATVEVSNKSGAKIMSRPYSSSSTLRRTDALGKVLKVTGKTTNQEGNVWYKLSDGNWVFSGNVKTHSHTYSGGMCTNTTCKYEYPYTVTAHSETRYVINKDGAKIWSRPYSVNSTHKRTEAYGKALTITAKTTNKDGNLWYKLSDGSWVFSGNTGKRYSVKFNANGGSSAPGTQYVLEGATLKLSSTKPVRKGYTFSGWSSSSAAKSVTHKPGTSYTFKSSTTLYAVWKACKHTYTGGICSGCGYEYPLTETACSGTYVVTNDNGAPVRNRPYSKNATTVRTEKYQKALTVKAYATNQEGNRWYKLSDGNWVYSGNVTERFTVKYSANKGSNAPSSQTFLSGKSVTITKSVPTREQYFFKGWSTSSSSSRVSYKAGDKYSKDKSITLYAVWEKCEHKYNDSGVCTACKYKYKITLDTSVAGTYVVTESNGALIRNTPYSVSGSKVRTAKKYELLNVTGKAENAHKNVWYKLSDGNWIYSERVASGYKVTYKANGGSDAPSATGFVSGKLTVSSTVPKRSGYIFMGWATSASATTASYKTGDTYNVKKNITLYAVWESCTHNYENNYGICKTCKSEFPLVVTSTSEIVFAVNNKNGTTTYKRPYSKTSEKVKTLKNGNYILVTGYATNANGEVWYKLKDGNWIKKSEVKKYATYNSIDSIPHKYALLMIGDTADGGIYRTETVQGVKYVKYFDSKNTFFLKVGAFEGSSKNSQLSTVNKNMTDAINIRSSATENFVYNKKTTKKVKALSSVCGFNNSETHNHITWDISAMTAKAGISGSDGIYIRCQNDAKTLTIEYCTYAKHFDHVWAHISTIYPEFTVSATPYAENGDAIGWFTDFSMLGKGYKTKKFAISDYVDLFSCAVKGAASVGKFVLAPTPDNALKALKGTWKFATDATSATKSTNYSSDGKNSLTYVDNKTSTAYRTYKMSVESPINLQSPNDFLEAHIYLYQLNKTQEISVKLAIK